MFRASRQQRDESSALVVWKVRIFALGAALALAGMAFTLRWLVWAGIGVLGVGAALRFVKARD